MSCWHSACSPRASAHQHCPLMQQPGKARSIPLHCTKMQEASPASSLSHIGTAEALLQGQCKALVLGITPHVCCPAQAMPSLLQHCAVLILLMYERAG